jgi:drug/metabolite transporter superfamily protein YnfA
MMRSPARRPRLGLLVSWFVAFWVAGVRPSLATLLAAWTVYAALSERPQVGREWAAFGGILTVLFAVLALQTHL